jgi:hypothetical protein
LGLLASETYTHRIFIFSGAGGMVEI